MIEVRGQVRGGKELAQAFRALPGVMAKRVLQSSAQNVGRAVARDFKAATPRADEGARSPASQKYGHAADNLRARRLRRAVGVRVNWGAAFWMRFYEYGSRHQPARPVFRPLWEANLGAYTQRYVQALVQGIQREARKIAATYGKARRSLGARRRF